MAQGSKFEKNIHAKRVQMQRISLQTRLGGEICSSDVIMHKGHYYFAPPQRHFHHHHISIVCPEM